MRLFGEAVDEYDAGRPQHPSGVFDALEPLQGRRVLDVGAGTGIATRALSEGGAEVVAVDTDPVLLRRARRRSPTSPAVVADGAQLPVRDASIDVVTFAQSWHWLDPDRRCSEVRRVLRTGGTWAAWWSHARADGEPWFDASWAVLERSCPGVHRDQRDTDWGATIEASSLFDVATRASLPWVRQLSVDDWMADQSSHSYVVALPAVDREDVLDEVRGIVEAHHPTGAMAVPYETWLWVATPRRMA